MIENRGTCRELFALTTSTVFLSFVTSDLTISTCVGQAMVALRYIIKKGQYLLQKKKKCRFRCYRQRNHLSQSAKLDINAYYRQKKFHGFRGVQFMGMESFLEFGFIFLQGELCQLVVYFCLQVGGYLYLFLLEHHELFISLVSLQALFLIQMYSWPF